MYVFLWLAPLHTFIYALYYRVWRLFLVGSAGRHAGRTCIPGVPCVFHAYHIIFHKFSICFSKHCPLCVRYVFVALRAARGVYFPVTH